MKLAAAFRHWGFTALLAIAPSAAIAELPVELSRALLEANIPDTQVGILVREIGNPVPLLAHGEQREFNPASLMKLVTTLAAMDSLGPAHEFKTRVLTDGGLVDGVLRGNLIFEGGGDPALTLERFWLLLRELRERGVREIDGDVIADPRYYQLAPIPDAAGFDQAPLRPYNAQPSAMLVNFNTLNLRLSVLANGLSARIEPTPDATMLAVVDEAKISDGACNGWRDKLSLEITDNTLHLSGSYPLACGEQTVPLNLLPPEATLAVIFNALWKSLGGVLHGKFKLAETDAGEQAAPPRLLLEFASPPMAQLTRDINKNSNNVMAKMLYLNLGAARYGAPATWEKAERAVRAWANERGIEMPELVLENGSGLSRIERISAASLARLLDYAAERPAYYEFAASLPAVGLEGTQKGRMNGTSAVGAAWLKSGTLDGVRNLAGYVLGPHGRRRSLVFLINHANAAAAGQAQSALLTWALK